MKSRISKHSSVQPLVSDAERAARACSARPLPALVALLVSLPASPPRVPLPAARGAGLRASVDAAALSPGRAVSGGFASRWLRCLL